MTTRHLLIGSTALFAACLAPVADPPADPATPGGKADGASATRGLPASLVAWGGADPARWTPEAILANAATAELQRDPAARVSIPAALWRSDQAPFGDGQTNAAASLASWNQPRPPVIGTRHRSRLTIRVDRALPFDGDTFELWTATGAWIRSVPSTRTSDGDWLVELEDFDATRFVVSPRGWQDGFPLAFALPTSSVAALAATLESSQRALPSGEPVVDPVAVAGAASVSGALRSTSLPSGFNQQPFVTDRVHAAFPQGGAPRVTAVGGAATWLTGAPFKNIYICFDARDPAREAQFGVPSGSGWHHIGDPGESILASLEDSPVLAGYAADAPLAPPSGGRLAFGLDHALTFGLVQPGQAFTTPRGDYHWYAVHQSIQPCAQIWVHACAPSADAPSMACD